MNSWAEYQKTARATQEARDWLAIIGKRTNSDSTARVSRAHCHVKLVIAGQFSHGGNNYWESPAAFNEALVAVIMTDWANISAKVMERMEAAERAKLTATEAELQEAMAAVQAAKEAVA